MTTVDTAAPDAAAPQRRRLVARPSTWVVWALVAAFFIFLIGILVSVLMDSFGRRWFGGWLPEELTADWYAEAWDRFNMTHVIGVTVGVGVTVVVISVLIGVPAAYLLARRNFPGKQLITLLFLLPIIIPPITYGIPLATVMYNVGLGRTLAVVVLVNLVPSVPFVIMTMTDRKSTRLNSSHVAISYAVFCLKKKNPRNPGSAVRQAAHEPVLHGEDGGERHRRMVREVQEGREAGTELQDGPCRDEEQAELTG